MPTVIRTVIEQQQTLASTTPATISPPGTITLYANNGEYFVVDDSGQQLRIPARNRVEQPTGTKDGINDTFTLAGGKNYLQGSLQVFLNGVAYQEANIVENGPGYTTFTVQNDNLPNSDDAFEIVYTEGV